MHAVSIMTGSSCSTRDHAPFAEQWAPGAQPETAIWRKISEIAVQFFTVRTLGMCSTRDCITGNNIKHGWPSDHAPFAEQSVSRDQPETALRGTISNMADQVTMLLLQNNGCHVINQRLRYGEQYQTWLTKWPCSFCRTMGVTWSTRDCVTGNNIKHGWPSDHAPFAEHGCHVINQRLRYGEQYQTWLTKWPCFFCRTMGVTWSLINQRLRYGEQYQTWLTKWPCSFCRTMGDMCSTRDCVTGNNIKYGWPSDHPPFAEQWVTRAQPETALRETILNMADYEFAICQLLKHISGPALMSTVHLHFCLLEIAIFKNR